MLTQARLAWALGSYCEMVRLNNADRPSNNHHHCRHQKGFAKTHCHRNWLLLLIGIIRFACGAGVVCRVGLIHVFSARRRLRMDQKIGWKLSDHIAGCVPTKKIGFHAASVTTTVNLFLSGYIFGAARHDTTSAMNRFGNVALMRFRNFTV